MAELSRNVSKGSHGESSEKSQSYASRHQIADHFIGGNKLDNAAPSSVKDFVVKHDGHTVIKNVS